MSAACTGCGRPLVEGDTAWASDWKVALVTGKRVEWRTETRYTCDDCEAKG